MSVALTTSKSQDHLINATRAWLDEVVIEHNFCPFARFVRDPERIRYRIADGGQQDLLEALAVECEHLGNHPSTSTTLIILQSTCADDFIDFLDLLDIANQLICQLGYEGTYQLASFHPDYQFAGEAEDAPSHFTNRSPFPVLHLIRECDIEAALAKYDGDAADIYEQNIQTATELGSKYFSNKLTRLRQCPVSK